MSTLYTFGCSFTSWNWPTWADMLGTGFDGYENWGIPGSGNRSIAERVAEMVAKTDLQDDDVIVVQWTYPHRYDHHMWADEEWMSTWRMSGNIHLNPGAYSEGWVKEYWNEQSYVMHTYNFILMTQSVLAHLPCKFFMTSVDDMRQDYKKFPEFSIYKGFLEGDSWIPPMYNYMRQSESYKERTFNDANNGQKNVKDPHPNPLAHYDYAKKFIADPLGLKLDKSFAERADRSLDQPQLDYREIEQVVYENTGWRKIEHTIKGF